MIKNFDNVTKFRLKISFMFAMTFNIILPVVADLKGELLTAFIISVFMILTTLSLKTNRILVKRFNIHNIYVLGIFIHLSYLISALLYFYDKEYFIYVDSILGIIDIAMFSALSILLNSYLAKNYPKDMEEFGIVSNNLYANGTLIGLGISTILSYYNTDITVIVSIILGSMFSLYMMYNFNYYKNNI